MDAVAYGSPLTGVGIVLFAPVVLDDAHGAHFQTHRVAAKFGDEVEAVNVRRRPQVGGVAELDEVDAAASDLQSSGQDGGMVLEAIPRKAGAVVEAHLVRF